MHLPCLDRSEPVDGSDSGDHADPGDRSRGMKSLLVKAMYSWLLLAGIATAQESSPDEVDPTVLEALRSGEAVVLMRHALAPGVGDPANFTREDCATQRNLSAAGRAQARAVGERLAGLLDGQPAAPYSSAWCRCLDTALLLDLGPVEPLPALDSFFRERDAEAARTESLERWIEERLAAKPAPPTAVLVTHQVNITALSGEFVSSGEMVVVGFEDGASVLAKIATDVPADAGR